MSLQFTKNLRKNFGRTYDELMQQLRQTYEDFIDDLGKCEIYKLR